MGVGEILFNIVQVILKKLGSLALEEIQLSLSLKNDLKKLGSALSTISAVLLDAQQQQGKSHAVSDWLQKLKDTLNDAQDLLDDLTAEALSQKVEAQFVIVTKVRNFFFCVEMGRRVLEIRERLDAIAEERNKFHFREQLGDDRNPIIAKRESTHSFVRVSEVLGRENDIRAIIEMLFSNSDENLSVIPIVGIGGLGKTTLAQLAFNDNQVKGYFDLSVWISVSDDLSAKVVAQKIVRAVTGADFDHLDMLYLHSYLGQIFYGRKFLLVLDDVWTGNHVEWDGLKKFLETDAKGSKIVVTTRNRYAASVMGGSNLYSLPGLPSEACWSLFEKWAFGDGESRWHPNLTQIGQDIVEKCGGVPLAIRTLGSLLYLITDESYWLFVKNDESWDISKREDDIRPVLKLSYDQLPSHLKECFLYCSLLPKGQEFDKETLIQLWMAQGFIQSSDRHQHLEDIGSWYFDELVSRSLIDAVPGNYKAEIVKFRMHDLLHDLAKSVAGKEYLTNNFDTSESTRHVSFWGPRPTEDARLLPYSPKLPKLRTLLFPIALGSFPESFLNLILSKSTYLRVLDLSYSGIKYLPDCIGDMRHLRYLNLNGNHALKHLSASICRLHSLQTLKLLGCVRISSFPRKFSNLVSLRHLIINSPKMRIWEVQLGSLTSLQSLAIMHCDNLVSLSEGVKHLSALRTLRIHNCGKLTSLPMTLKNCTALENLEVVNCSKLRLYEECMQGLTSLRSLTIKGLPKLVTLPDRLECYASTLRYLFISNCLSLMRLPECLGTISSLKRIYIIWCPNLLELPSGFRHLASLQVLQIDQCALLSIRCQRNAGEDWNKIEHVPEIYVDKMKL